MQVCCALWVVITIIITNYYYLGGGPAPMDSFRLSSNVTSSEKVLLKILSKIQVFIELYKALCSLSCFGVVCLHYQVCFLESLFGGSSRGTQLLLYP